MDNSTTELHIFLDSIDDKLKQHTRYDNSYTQGYFLLGRPRYGFTEESLTKCCNRLNIPFTETLIRSTVANDVRYNHIRSMNDRSELLGPNLNIHRKSFYQTVYTWSHISEKFLYSSSDTNTKKLKYLKGLQTSLPPINRSKKLTKV